MNHLLILVPLIIAAVVVFLAPELSPRYALFGVRVLPAIRSSPQAGAAIATFRTVVALGLLAALALAFFVPLSAAVAPPVVLMVFASAAWMWQYRRFRPLASVPEARPVEVTLSGDADRLPAFMWVSVLPFAVLIGSALYLWAHWDRIPPRFPIHWGAAGEPNGWADRSIRRVFGQLIFGALFTSWLLVLAVSLWSGVRRSNYRIAVLKMLVSIQVVMGLVPSVTALAPLMTAGPRIAAVFIVISVVGVMAFALWTAIRANALPDADTDSPASPALTGSLFYFNRHDPALAVPRRIGFGYVINFGHLRAWLLIAMPFAIAYAASHWLF